MSAQKKTVNVAVTGAAGQIGYALLFRIASGEIFGPETKVRLQLLELEPALKALEGVRMELEDCAFPLLDSVLCTSKQEEAFADADWALLVGSVPRKDGMERADLLKINGGIFIGQGQALAKVARKDCRVLVVGNPCNTNAWIAKEATKGGLPAENFYAMTMLDQNRAVAALADKAQVPLTEVEDLVIWGNHSPTMYPDFDNAKISSRPVTQAIEDHVWLKGAFLEMVGKRGAAIIKARGASSAASAANAVIDSVRKIVRPDGKAFSLAVVSDGSFGVPEGLISSFPVRVKAGKVEIIEDTQLTDFAKEKIKLSVDELLSEREAVKELL